VRSVGTIDVGSPAALVFALVTDPRHARDWSTLFEAPSASTSIADGDHVPLRWHWRGVDELVDATIAFDERPFRVRYEGKTDDGTRFDVEQRIVATAIGSRVDVAVGIDGPRDGRASARAQRELERSVARMTARIYELTDRTSRATRIERATPLLRREAPGLRPVRARRRSRLLGALRRLFP
jgi:hypothetical protein